MGLFNKKNKASEVTPEFKKNTDESQCPDLTEYKRAILLHNISLDDVTALIEEYSTIAAGQRMIMHEFHYAILPESTGWIYLEYTYSAEVPHYMEFYHYQNLTIWLSQKSDKEFCLAIPLNQYAPLFLSVRDTKNPYGDSMAGIYADRDFYFTIPSETFEWGPIPDSKFDYAGYLKTAYGFNTILLPNIKHCRWSECKVYLPFS